MDNIIDTYKFVEDENELKWFWSKLPKLESTESYYFCMAARAKKLSEEDKKKYVLGRSEMFYPEIMYNSSGDWKFEDFVKHVYKMQVDKRAFLTKNYLAYPDNSLICYFYPNPCSEIACIRDFKKYTDVMEDELIMSVQKGSTDGIKEQLNKLSHSGNYYKTCHSKNTSRKIWVDFDFDLNDFDLNDFPLKNRDIIESSLNIDLQRFFPKNAYLTIRTSGGIHVLVDKRYIKFNPAEIGEYFMSDKYKDDFKEVVKNETGFIPLPGTKHYLKNGGFITVQVINKDNFNEF